MTKAFVVGHPIKHSRSPLIHGHWLKEYGLDGSYERIDVAPVDFGDFLSGFREHAALPAATSPSRTRRRPLPASTAGRRGPSGVKAVNTLWVEDGLLWGDNTDVARLHGPSRSTWGQAGNRMWIRLS